MTFGAQLQDPFVVLGIVFSNIRRDTGLQFWSKGWIPQLQSHPVCSSLTTRRSPVSVMFRFTCKVYLCNGFHQVIATFQDQPTIWNTEGEIVEGKKDMYTVGTKEAVRNWPFKEHTLPSVTVLWHIDNTVIVALENKINM